MRSKTSAYQTCSRHHYWTHLRAWVTGQQYFHACDVTWTSVTGRTYLAVDGDYFPVIPHGGDITILPDCCSLENPHDGPPPDRRHHWLRAIAVVPEVPLDGIARLRKRLGR